MDGRWILGALLGLAWLVVGARAVRWATGRATRSREARVEGTWQYDVRREMLKDGPRFQANVHYFTSMAAIGLCIAVAAVLSAVPLWLGVLGLTMAVFAALCVEARVRYGTGRLVDLGRVARSWLGLGGVSR
jgi:hypothetical protein